ncbi:PREDICTED: uncharacterized protein LOC108366351 [Rhagoletis zephyria]|uniref:uncharacterized protein LOC108366351 n=1 Tax=Rhagoletis zephyria TaxID=28612 RepID=UPI000811810B|nr:PREDICTED: uncharacterized protein LOC108366351 [Rhagoletis zephyria]XP_017476216.1 PREDICTED: uncharacterized protein LOC108366351 [Rhagoletis zephyria]
MENTMNKTQLATELRAAGVIFGKDATVADLRAMYSAKLGKNSTGKKNSDQAIQSNSEKSCADDRKLNTNDESEQENLNDSPGEPKTKTAIQLYEIQLEEELLDAKLRVLEKKKRIFELESGMCSPLVQQFMKPSYKDVKHLVPLFSGSDDYDAEKWLGDFERACDAINAHHLNSSVNP